jgi:hypothetical protein
VAKFTANHLKKHARSKEKLPVEKLTKFVSNALTIEE